MIKFSGKKFLITGASSGIGRETAILLSKLGAKIVACGRNERRLAETLDACEGEGHLSIVFDVRETASFNDFFKQATADGKKLNGLVYCAGIAPPTPLRVLSEQTIREVLDVNLVSFMMMTAMYAKRPFNDGGSIVAISSVNSHYPQKCMSVYAASKNALEAFALTTALELAEKNIRINCVIPGAVDTPMLKFVIQKFTEYYNQHTLLKIGFQQNNSPFSLVVMKLRTSGPPSIQ